MSTMAKMIIHSETWVGVLGEITSFPMPTKEIFHVTSQ